MGRPKGSKNKPKVQDGTPISNKTVNTAASTSTSKSKVAPKTTKTVNTKSTTTRNQTKKLDKVDKLLLNKSATVPTIDTPKGKKTVAEMSTTLTKHERVLEMAKTTKAMIDALQLTDLSKTESRTFKTYSRETLRTYMKSPKSYESQLRNLSRYLYRLCYEYRRICLHYATMICGDAFNIIPLDDPTQEMTPEERTNTWYETMIRWQRMDFASELVKLLLVAWREDSVYAYVYDDSDQEGGTCFYQILDGDYCRVSSVEAGVFRFAFDFSYFRSHETYLEYWDSEFKSKYEAYQKDSTLRWQELEPERQVCFKVNSDDPTMDFVPLGGLLEVLINAVDLQSIQAVKDELSAYKLLVARLKPLSGTSDPDDFEIDPDTALKYYNKLAANVPPCVNVVLSPMDIDTIEFSVNLDNTSRQTLKVKKSTKVYNWVETRIKHWSDQVQKIADKITDYIKKSLKTSLLKQQIRKMNYEIGSNQKGAKTYMKKANSIANEYTYYNSDGEEIKTNVPKKYQKLVQKGAYRIEDMDTSTDQGKALAEAIDQYKTFN